MKKLLIATSMAFTLATSAMSQPVWAKDVVDVADLVEQQGPAVVNVSTTKLGAGSLYMPLKISGE